MKQRVLCLALAVFTATLCVAAPTHPTLTPVAERWMNIADGMGAPTVLNLPSADRVRTASVEYVSGRSMDIYYPADFDFNRAAPVVVFAMGYSTDFTMNWFGAKLKDIGQYVSWGQLVAASGMIGVAYETDYPDDDIDAVLGFILKNGSNLGMDSRRIALFACSGNTMTALGALAAKDAAYRSSLRCGVVMYPVISYFMNTGDDVLPAPFKRQLRDDVPIFMVTIGNERPEWKDAVSTFLAGARERAYPIEVSHFEQGVHGFDTDMDNDESRALIARSLAFMKDKLTQ
jgi:hypothetical protein